MQKTIAISGLPGAGSTTIARLISKKLSIGYFGLGQLFKDIAKGKLEGQHYYDLFKVLCNKANLNIPYLNSDKDSHAARDLWNTEFGKSKEFHNILDELQSELAEKGNIIIDGKLSLHILSVPCKVWLKASIRERARRTAQRDGLDFKEAKGLITRRQEKEYGEWKKIYGLNYLDQESKADLMIDTTNLAPKQVADKIISVLNQ